MYHNVMVPLDGSGEAESALHAAADIAVRSRAKLHLVRVVSWLHELTDMSTPRTPRRYILRMASRINAEYPGLDVHPHLTSDAINGVAYGDPPRRAIAEVLDEFATAHHIDLTVLTTHGRGGFKRLWLGSVADSMLRFSNRSMLLLRSGRSRRHARHPDTRRILIPVDLSQNQEEVIARALELGELYNAEYTLFHVSLPALTFMAAGGSEIMEPAYMPDDAAQELLEKLATPLRDIGHTVHTAVTTAPFVPAEILTYLSEHPFDLVAVATIGPNSLTRGIMGSVADKLIRGSRTPVLACNVRRQ